MGKVKITAVVLKCDGVPDSENEVFDLDTLTLPNGPVAVTKEYDPEQYLGRATFRREGTDIVADIELEDENGYQGLIPCIAGRADPIQPGTEGVKVLRNARLTGLGFSVGPNSDDRVEPLK